MTNAELIAALRNCSDGFCSLCPFDDYELSTKECEAKLMLDAADALEAAEKRIAELMPKEGEWIWDADTGIYRCSECGGASPREDQDGEYIDCPNYCQNCGAKMKGGQNEREN